MAVSSLRREDRATSCPPMPTSNAAITAPLNKPSGASPKKIAPTAKPRQQRVPERVGQQREPPQHDERAQKSVGETHQHAAQQRALHELVMKRLGQPMSHGTDSREAAGARLR